MSTWIYPGSFDPITLGHLDVICRGAKLCDTLYIAVLKNSSKNSMFSYDERVEMIDKCSADLQNVKIDFFEGLLVDYAKKVNANAILKGVRSVVDFEYEIEMAALNKKMDDNLETIFLGANSNYLCVSSSRVKEIASLGGNIKGMVSDLILDDVLDKINRRNK